MYILHIHKSLDNLPGKLSKLRKGERSGRRENIIHEKCIIYL